MSEQNKMTLEDAARAFIFRIRNRGMGQLMPDEINLLNVMASELRRLDLQRDRLSRKHVVQRGMIGFTYRPTPPSGPSPDSGPSHEPQEGDTT